MICKETIFSSMIYCLNLHVCEQNVIGSFLHGPDLNIPTPGPVIFLPFLDTWLVRALFNIYFPHIYTMRAGNSSHVYVSQFRTDHFTTACILFVREKMTDMHNL